MPGARIQIVEDEVIVGMELKDRLTRFGYEVVTHVTNGEEAVEQALALHPDLILMDIMIKGGIDGIGAADLIRKQQDIPIIFLTAYSDEETINRAKITAPLGYLLKPVEDRELKTSIEIALYKHDLEKKLKESETKYRHIFEDSPIGIYRLARDGTIILANPALVKMLGYNSWQELAGIKLTDIVFAGGTDRKDFERRLEKDGSAKNFESKWLKKDESPIYIRENCRMVRDSEGNFLYYEGTVDDITREKELNEQLLQSQKLQSIGQLAAGIAHDYNNLLTVINGSAEVTLMKLEKGHPAHGHVVSILSAGKRAKNLTSQLLAFSRKQPFNPKIIDLDRFIDESHKLLQRLIGSDIKIKYVIQDKAIHLKVDRIQLEQVFINLAVNARDAIREKALNTSERMIEIVVRRQEINADTVPDTKSLKPGSYVAISFSDNGNGMNEQTRKRIFDPFFTTKKEGMGTGLGLATVYGIIKQNEGHIEVKSRLGSGTTFTIYWPEWTKDTGQPEKSKKDIEIQSGEGLILVIEDESSVRHLISNTLFEFGYEVTAAKNGMEALQLMKDRKLKPDLIITDLAMPEMDGEEFIRTINEDHTAHIPILAISGYVEEDVLQKLIRTYHVQFLPKPFSPKVLMDQVKKLTEKEEAITDSAAPHLP